jgi:hypothetical protein
MYLNSRYVTGAVRSADLNGEVVYTVDREFPIQGDFLLYRWKAGDRIDWISQALGIPRLKWWMVLDANPTLRCPTMIRPGDVIKIPRIVT